jgi:signal transduction histidine kinase
MEMPSPERVRIARELHDGIAQDLVGIGYSLDVLLSEESLSNNARTEIRTTRFAVDELISKVRREILHLRKMGVKNRVQAIEKAKKSGLS